VVIFDQLFCVGFPYSPPYREHCIRQPRDESILGPTLGPHATQGPSPIKGPITRGMLKKIQKGFS